MDRIAVISDIHANLPALEAVLADIRRKDIQRILCLGDLVGKGPNPAEAVDIIRETCETVVMGNWDELVATKHGTEMWDFYRDRLGAERLRYLSGLPFSVDFDFGGRRVRLFHASSKSVHVRVQPWDDPADRLALFENTEATGGTHGEWVPDVVGYGDIHHAYLQYIEGKTLFNVGSVGNPLDIPKASYAVLEGTNPGDPSDVFHIQFVRVAYDVERAIHDAESVGMPLLAEYANELRTAKYRGLKE